MRRFVFTFCALLSSSFSAVAAESYTLVPRWQVNFGRGQDRATYRTAACPDGTFYLSDNFGRLAVVDADGKVSSREVRKEFVGRPALACDAESHLYLATPREILIFRNGAVATRTPVDVQIAVFAPAADGTIYAAGSLRGSSLSLHEVDRGGAVVQSFGIGPEAPFNRIYPRADGKLVWQEGLGRLLYIPRWREFEIQAYTADGQSIGIFGARSPHILPVRIATGGEPALGHATGAARLPHDEIAIQRELLNRGLGMPSRVIEIYDTKLRRRGMAASDGRDLAGASADGDLYLTTLSPRGLQVFRVGLIKRSSL